MSSFIIRTEDDQTIRFQLYIDVAPITSAAFIKTLPFSRTFIHARVSGQEIWTDDGVNLDIIQENSSVFTVPGEIVSGPLKPSQTLFRVFTKQNKFFNAVGGGRKVQKFMPSYIETYSYFAKTVSEK